MLAQNLLADRPRITLLARSRRADLEALRNTIARGRENHVFA